MNIVSSIAGSAFRVATPTVLAVSSSRSPIGQDNPLIARQHERVVSKQGEIRARPSRGFQPDKTLFRQFHPTVFNDLTDEEHVDANVAIITTGLWNHNTTMFTEPSPSLTMRVRPEARRTVQGPAAKLTRF